MSLMINIEGSSPEELLNWAIKEYSPDIALACSLETPVLVHMLTEAGHKVRIFSIDTGRLPEETYQCAADLERRYGFRIEWYFPKYEQVEQLLRTKGPYSFRNSLAERHECCDIRKVEPLSRALSGLEAWITGLRKDQNVTRSELKKIEKDNAHNGITKINPLADWTAKMEMDYIRKNNIPYNKLLDKGYTSIGCNCCTRAVKQGEDPRAGRWWWESPEHKECGIHLDPSIFNNQEKNQ